MSAILPAPPSAVCSTAEPCAALVEACCRIATSLCSLVPTARPDASSEALVMREPLASFATELDSALEFRLRYRTALLAAVLVPMTGIEDLQFF
jgi:hypothetical protein